MKNMIKGFKKFLSKENFHIRLEIFLLIVIPFLVFSNVYENEFVWDDHAFITGNRAIRNLFSFSEYFTPENRMIQRPIAVFSFAIDYSLWKLNPSGYHFSNIIIHSINVILIYIIVLIVLKSNEVAFVAGLLFSVHPIHSETVATFLGRSDLLTTFFLLLAFLSYLSGLDTSIIKRGVSIFLSSLFYLGACFSKETGAVFILLVLFHRLLFINMRGKKIFEIVKELGPYMLIFIFYFIFRTIMVEKTLVKIHWWEEANSIL